MNLRYLPHLIRAAIDGQYLGDIAILKATLKGLKPTTEISIQLQNCTHLCFDYSSINFSSYPQKSFGHAYHQHMNKEKLTPFRFSGRYQHLLQEQQQLTVHYATVHDFFHVLTGFDTSLAGEAGVWGFVAGQNYSPDALQAWKLTKIVYPLISPFSHKSILESAENGYMMGCKASTLLTVNFLELFSKPLNEVQKSLNIQTTT